MSNKGGAPLLRVCVIGKGGLAIDCAEVLAGSCELRAVISDHPAFLSWAAARRVWCANSLGELPDGFFDEIDYLFSIANGCILDPRTLSAPQCGCINYHNGPLPRYAGVHATSWAIFNGETTHGVTWHMMTPQIDGGDILQQATFSLDPGETTASLNRKCSEVAGQAFRQLLRGLLEGRLTRRPQERKLRSYYGLHQKIPGAGLICWDQTAVSIDRLWRTLEFGPAPNALGSAKVRLTSGTYVVRSLELASGAADTRPGTVVQTTAEGISVATSEGGIVLRHLTTLEGKPFSLAQAMETMHIQVGARLPFVSPHEVAAAEELAAHASPHERFWLMTLHAALLRQPAADGGPSEKGGRSTSWSLPLPPSSRCRLQQWSEAHGLSESDFLEATAALCHFRFSGRPTVFLHQRDEVSADADPCSLICPYLPIPFDMSPTQTATKAVLAVVEARRNAERHVPLLRDVFVRSPLLRQGKVMCGFAFTSSPMPEDVPAGVKCDLVIRAAVGSSVTLEIASCLPDFPLPAFVRCLRELIESILQDPSRPLLSLPILDRGASLQV